ncbi:hypothetical protein [Croceivirga radicis]|uniref:hypothetical protein n=1 Tax=Croceivirga radicis TaxID=1929488 RepID=UPI000255B869|nr:hypothetical protein [Croceivirga radicis]
MNSKKYYRILNIPLQEKDDSQIILGGIFIFIIIIVTKILPIDFEFRVVIQFIILLFSSAWAAHRAEILNRNIIVWGILGFIFPPITLIILGLLGTRIGIEPIKKIVSKYRKKFEETTLNIELPEKDEIKFKSKVYGELSAQLKKDISKKFTELNIQPENISKPNKTSSPSSFTIWIGGLITALSSKGNHKEESNVNKARNGYLFNLVVLIIIIAVLVYIIFKS